MRSPSRRALLASLGSAALAGCSGRAWSAGGVGDRFAETVPCDDANRPEPSVEGGVEYEWSRGSETRVEESVGSVAYPSPPDTFTAETVREFVHDYEVAYHHNATLDRSRMGVVVGVSTYAETLGVRARDDDRFVVPVRSSGDVRTYRDGTVLTADGAILLTVYGVDPTGIARVFAGQQTRDTDLVDELPDPVEAGQLLECF